MSLLRLSRKKKSQAQEQATAKETVAPVVKTASKPDPAALYSKPTADLYTVLLVIALIAVLVGILFLYLEMNLYDFKLKGGPAVGMLLAPMQRAMASLPGTASLAWCLHPFL